MHRLLSHPVATDWLGYRSLNVDTTTAHTDIGAAFFRREYSLVNDRHMIPALYSPNVVLYARVEYLTTDKAYKREAFVYFKLFKISVITFLDCFSYNKSLSNLSSRGIHVGKQCPTRTTKKPNRHPCKFRHLAIFYHTNLFFKNLPFLLFSLT